MGATEWQLAHKQQYLQIAVVISAIEVVWKTRFILHMYTHTCMCTYTNTHVLHVLHIHITQIHVFLCVCVCDVSIYTHHDRW